MVMTFSMKINLFGRKPYSKHLSLLETPHLYNFSGSSTFLYINILPRRSSAQTALWFLQKGSFVNVYVSHTNACSDHLFSPAGCRGTTRLSSSLLWPVSDNQICEKDKHCNKYCEKSSVIFCSKLDWDAWLKFRHSLSTGAEAFPPYEGCIQKQL